MSKKAKSKKAIIRRNAGLGDNLLATAHIWYYAQQTGRDLEICWAPSMYFSNKSVNSFGAFFKVPNKIGNVNIIYNERINLIKRLYRKLPFFPRKFFFPAIMGEAAHKIFKQRSPAILKSMKEKRRKWLMHVIKEGIDSKRSKVVFNSHFNFLEPEKIKPFFDTLELQSKYQERVNHFRNKNFKGKKVVGVHVRYYDKSLPFSNHTQYWLEPDKSFEHIKNELGEIIKKLNNEDYVIYLATDNKIVFQYFSENMDNLVVYNKKFHNVSFTAGLHHKLEENSFADDLVEMFLLANAHVLYRYPPSGSWFSFYGSLYAKEVVMK